MSSNQNDEKVESTNDASQQHDDNDVIENETEARLVKDFQKLRVAPPSSLKSTMGAANYKIMREKCDKDWKFWKSQPMPAFDDPDPEPENSGPIEPNTPFEELRKEPLHLPEQFSWVDLDLTDDKDTMEIFDLLAKYYVEDDDGVFRFCYQIEFLRWALMPPGYRKEFHIGVRVTATNKLVGFISAIPSVSRVYDTTFPTVEINFLCVHKKLRTQRLAPVLIREVTRRVNLTGVFQAVYTAGVLLPKPIAVCRYWHRTLNPKKLIEVGFTALSKRMTMARAIKLYRVDATPKIKGLREMEKRDVKAVTLLLNSYLQKFNMANIFSEEEVEHWFTPRDRIIHCYVVEGNDGKLTDMLSFYGLPSTIIGNEKYKTLNAAYLFYCVPNKHSIQQMVAAALSLAVSLDYDVMNCLDILDYSSVLKELKFGEGDGALHYYVYNYRTKTMPPSHVGLVMM